jgi:hypothetical protein
VIDVKAGIVSRGMGFQSLGIESLRPRWWVVNAIGPGDDVPGHAHVINLSHPCGIPAVLLEMLGHAGAFLALVTAEHEGLPGGSADCSLAVGPLKQHSLLGQLVDIGRSAKLVTIATEHAGLQVVRDQEQHVLDCGGIAKTGGQKKKKCNSHGGNT